MSSSSGNSSGSCPTSAAALQLISGSEGDMQQQHVMDQRKRKRMQSNRESARRSRMRKQKLLDDLTVQVGQLRKDNNDIMSSINVTTQHFLNVEAENAVLRAQMAELSQRLESLNEMINFINSGNGGFESDGVVETSVDHSFMNNPMNLLCVNHPIMASSADMMMY